MVRNSKSQANNGGFVGEAAEPGLSIADLHLGWDSSSNVRQRLRDGSGAMHSRSGLSCDNHTCKINNDLLLPILHAMSENSQKKLPSVGDLRSELAKLFTVNKRVGGDIQGLVASEAIHIRKLLSFVKAKARRGEVSKVLRQHPSYMPIIQVTGFRFHLPTTLPPRILASKSCAWHWTRAFRLAWGCVVMA